MDNLYGQLNRPVHLARRDAFYIRALELLCAPLQHVSLAERIRNVSEVLACLKTAREHAFFSSHAPGAPPLEKDYLSFLDLMVENVSSLAAMLDHQAHLEVEKNFLSNFLGTTREQSVLPAFHYQRRAEDILQGLWHLLSQAQSPFHNLRKAALDTLSAAERDRYEKALQHFRGECETKFKPPVLNQPPTPQPVRST